MKKVNLVDFVTELERTVEITKELADRGDLNKVKQGLQIIAWALNSIKVNHG